MRRHRRGYLYAILFGALLLVRIDWTHAQTDAEAPLIELTSKTSLPQVSAGADFGVSVDIKNKAKTPIYVQGKWVTLVLPPELDAASPGAWWGSFNIPALTDQEIKDKVDWWTKFIALAPGDSTTAFWARTNRKIDDADKSTADKSGTAPVLLRQAWDFFDHKLKELAFAPGDYTIKFVVVYWTNKDDVGDILRSSRSSIFDVKIPVVAPQWVIIFGAIIGGLISYLLLPKVRLHPSKFYVSGLFTSALLSVIVTILLARISESQFLIRISVNDIWGAIAVGFIAGASGTSILKKWIPTDADTKKKDVDRADGTGASSQQFAAPSSGATPAPGATPGSNT